jgi:hypothetical protein
MLNSIEDGNQVDSIYTDFSKAFWSGADWDQKTPATDQKAPATFHTKKSKRPPKFLLKTPFKTFCMGDCKSPCDQHRIATMTNPALLLIVCVISYCWIRCLWVRCMWLGCCLSGRIQKIRIGDAVSKDIKVTSGVPQGSYLGALCFIWFGNRISEIFDCVRVLFYADDMKLFLPVSGFHGTAFLQDCLKIQSDLNKLSEWCDRNS